MRIQRIMFGLFLVISVLFGSVSAEKTGETGYYEIRTNVENASVTLDGVFSGLIKDGILRIAVPAGNKPVKRELKIESDGYEPYRETVVKAPKTGETVVLRGTLRSLPAARSGSLSLAVTPPGGKIFIDGQLQGSVDNSGILLMRGLSTGNRILQIQRDGYLDVTKRVYVEPNVVTKLRFTLIPATNGSLQVTSHPNGAEVSLNGAVTGITPLTIPDLPQGPYQVRIIMAGYQVWNGFANVTPGQGAEVTAVLVPETTQTITPEASSAPQPEPTEAAGIFPITGLLGVAAAFLLLQKKE